LKSEDYPTELIQSVAAVSRLLTANETVESTVGRIAQLSVLALDAADECGISLVTGKQIKTVAVTGEVGQKIDNLQIETGEGPCMSSIEKQATFYIPDMAHDETWPAFSARAAAETGISSLVGYVLEVGSGALGAINLMAYTPNAFDEDAIAVGAVFAAQAGVALSNAQTHEKNAQKVEQLEEGIQTRQVIGQAVGIVMATRHLNADEAFEILKTISQHTNVKLKKVAAGLVDRVDEL
jgi:transcriptional regulator with GAF, ATPase, and Fis domain